MKNSKLFNIIFLFFSISTFAQTVNLDSLFTSAVNHHNKGMTLIESGDKKAGLKELYLASDDFAEYSYYQAKQNQDSLKSIIEELLKNNPQSPVYHNQMGRWFINKNRDSVSIARAREYYEKAIKLEPEFIYAYNSLARLAQLQANNDEAIKYYKKVIEIDSTYYSAYLSISAIYSRAQMIDKAEELWDKIIRMDSTSSESISAMLYKADTKKTFDEKYSIYKKALRLSKEDKTPIYLRLISLLAFNKEAPDSAEKMLWKIVDSQDGNRRVIRQRCLDGIFNILIKKDRSRIPQYGDVVFNETNPELLRNLGLFIADSLGQEKLGIKYLEKAYEITTPENVYETVMFGQYDIKMLNEVADNYKYEYAAFDLGKTLYRAKDYVSAEKYLLESVPYKEKKKDPGPFYLLGYISKEKGKNDEAIKWIVKGLTMKEDAIAKQTLSKLIKDVNYDLRDNKNVEELIEQLIRKERMKYSETAPSFTLPSLTGGEISLSDLKGKVVMLDFWATWCGPCIAELPKLVKLYEEFSNNPNVVFLGIDADETKQIVNKFMKEKGYSFNVLLAVGTSVLKDYDVKAIPAKFLIDKNGLIQFKRVGSNLKDEEILELKNQINELLYLE